MLLVGRQCDVGIKIRSISTVEVALLGRVLLNVVVEAGSFVNQRAIILLPEEPKLHADWDVNKESGL